ncbi:hypothetical protein B23_0291 [Geobacillus thermoleovorans B23]|nr:hypothetical protein B23_0291 [Geobacillus thermoleovorans B23]
MTLHRLRRRGRPHDVDFKIAWEMTAVEDALCLESVLFVVPAAEAKMRRRRRSYAIDVQRMV